MTHNKDARVDYTPPGPVAAAFLTDMAPFVQGIMGPVGSGKSALCVVKMMMLSGRQNPDPRTRKRRTRWAIVRNTQPELKTTTMKTFFDWFDIGWGRFQAEGPPTFFWTMGDIDAEFIFLALDRDDDVKKLMSLELTGIWFNEARYVSKLILDAATGRVGRYPAKRDGGPTWSGVLMDTNPPDTDSWWYRFAEEEPQEGWRFYKQASGLADDAENVPNLPGGREYYTRQMAGKDPDWVKVYVHGQYGILMDGKAVFPGFVDATHCAPCEIMSFVPVVVGMDFGLTPAAVFMQKDAKGRWFVQREVVEDSMGAEQFGRKIREVLTTDYGGHDVAIYGDPAGSQRAQTDERTVFEVLHRLGVPVRATRTNNLEARLEAVRGPLGRMVEGKPGFVVSPACKVLRKALAGGYCYRKMQVSGSDRYAEVPAKTEFSHVADALQYALLGSGEGPSSIKGFGDDARRQERAITKYDPLAYGETEQYNPFA